MLIRMASEEDACAICGIYRPYVENTAVTFEYEAPDETEMARRIRETLKEYPYLAAVEDGRVIGYAYASAFHARAAYRHTAEVSIYLSEACTGRGIGRELYGQLERLLTAQNVFVLYACITTTPRREDPFLTDRSVRFHEKNGYTLIGRHDLSGYKFDRWYGVIWMEKVIAPRPQRPEPFTALRDLHTGS